MLADLQAMMKKGRQKFTDSYLEQLKELENLSRKDLEKIIPDTEW